MYATVPPSPVISGTRRSFRVRRPLLIRSQQGIISVEYHQRPFDLQPVWKLVLTFVRNCPEPGRQTLPAPHHVLEPDLQLRPPGLATEPLRTSAVALSGGRKSVRS